jgi:hypothetical protein
LAEVVEYIKTNHKEQPEIQSETDDKFSEIEFEDLDA